jgi:hypothetical protein
MCKKRENKNKHQQNNKVELNGGEENKKKIKGSEKENRLFLFEKFVLSVLCLFEN